MLTEYHFKIQYIKGTKNVRVDILSRNAELQNNNKPLGIALGKDNIMARINASKPKLMDCYLIKILS